VTTLKLDPPLKFLLSVEPRRVASLMVDVLIVDVPMAAVLMAGVRKLGI
jgi:hypothetical protein